MTYCVGILLNEGAVLLSDTRTNAGLDNIATYRKMFTFEDPGRRVVTILTAGSLSVTQTTIARLREAVKDPEGGHGPSLMTAQTMLDVATIVGNALAEVSRDVSEKLEAMGQSARASMIVCGQRKGGDMRMFLIYPEGNFIESTDDTPFLQIGEHKYGKPILDRVINMELALDDAMKCALLSMDSTLRSNLSVGMPLDMQVIRRGELKVHLNRRIEAGDEQFKAMSAAWSDALRESFIKITI